MDMLGIVVFHVVATMTVLIVVWLAMGKRQIGELSPVDLAISITAGTVAGASMVDPRIELSHAIVALVLLGVIQITISRLALKSRTLQHTVNFEPTVLVENGQIIKENLLKVRMTAEMLLQLLREKDVFDITEVELAIFEPHGKLSVLKKAEFLPVTANMLNISVPPTKVLVPVILEGKLQEKLLRKMGYTSEQIEDFRHQYQHKVEDVFIAFMDKNRNVHIVKDDVQENGVFLH